VNKRISAIILVFCTIFLSGCATRLVDFTVISTKNIDLARGADFTRGPVRVKGEDKVSIIIIIPTGNPNIKTAIDKAIESVPGAVALLDGVLTAKGWYIPYIYGESSYVVEGTPLIDPKLVLAKRPSNYIFCRADRKGNVKEIRYLSKAEFEATKRKLGV
jgi:hypothetical protein